MDKQHSQVGSTERKHMDFNERRVNSATVPELVSLGDPL